jgi:glutaredoxin
MMKIIRFILGKIILAGDALFPPRAEPRSRDAQAKLAKISEGLVLYQFETCPFCVKVRRQAKRLGLPIPVRDARPGTQGAQELLQGGGEMQVPCLKIQAEGSSPRWMYESSAIVAYLSELAGKA